MIINIYEAAKAALKFRNQYGYDACEDMPREYFDTINKAFGSEPSEAEIIDIEELSWGLDRVGQKTDRDRIYNAY
jgi:hypothetical protein